MHGSWVQTTGDPPWHRHKVVEVRAESLAPLEAPDAYADAPRRVLGKDGPDPAVGCVA
jgi:hypothetical protein